MEVVNELALKTTITINEQKYPFLVWSVENGEITAIKFADKIYTTNGTAKKNWEKACNEELETPTRKAFVKAPHNTALFTTYLKNNKYNDFDIKDFVRENPRISTDQAEVIVAYQIKIGNIQQLSSSTFRVLKRGI